MYYDLFKFPLYLMFHPLQGFEDLKREKKGKLYVANIFLVLMALLSILKYQNLGFLVNFNNPTDMNSIREVSTILVLVFLFVAGNWSITTLMDGKGKFKEIYMLITYAMFPVILLQYPNILFSHIVTGEEVEFFYLIDTVGYVYMGLLLVAGLIRIHEYSVTKMLLTVLFTIVAMGVIIFLGILFFSLIQQIFNFISAIVREISIRYL